MAEESLDQPEWLGIVRTIIFIVFVLIMIALFAYLYYFTRK